MLHIKLATNPNWIQLVNQSITDLLTDHAYCEQKAASSCISLITQYPEFEQIVAVLSPVVSEEWSHFRMVLEQLQKRGLKLGKPRRDHYVSGLQNFMHTGGTKLQQVTERLLMFALIEARSCERFRLLYKHLADTELKEFYRNLMRAEARHYRLFLELATELNNQQPIEQRWEEWLDYEAQLMQSLVLRGDRVH